MSNKPIKKGDRKTPWGKRELSHKREKKNLSIRNLFRIYCEGEVTEPEYFRAFPINPVTTKVFSQGYGRSKTSLVCHVIELLKKDGYLPGQQGFDADRQNWVVFDYDWKGEEGECADFKAAVELARQHGIRTAISNDAFEVWFLLHFQYVDTRMHRSTIYEKLSDLLGFDYEKEGKTAPKVLETYQQLLPFQPAAINHATALLAAQSPLDPCKQNPSTTVFKLVRELNKNLRA